MAILSKPLRKRRALLIAIQHVHREAGSKFGNLPNLDLAHRDAEALRDFLIASHGYHADDIILMMDDKNHPKHLWPTHDRILHQIDRLTSDAPEDCHFFFYFSGHCLKEDCPDRAGMRADGKDDEIVCADAKPILDHVLHDRLVEPLRNVKGSKLFTLFDCCHSEGLLDLQRGVGPNRYSRVWKIGPGQRFIDLSTVITDLCRPSLGALRIDIKSIIVELNKGYRQKHSNVPSGPTASEAIQYQMAQSSDIQD
ncbi:caspase domain-containing protein [Boletus coccyginus]|nr:caspase domain-containing protein [Boletus coccyginus]